MNAKFLENEFWYGGAVYEGYRQPVGAEDTVEWDYRENPTANQMMPFFISTKGRYIWSEEGFQIQFHRGEIRAEGRSEILLKGGFRTLRGAYLEAMKQHFPFHDIKLSKRFFEAPVYNTWIELTFYQEQEKVLEYARGILKHGLPAGILMIDDGWSPYYGKWQFRKDNFADAKGMIKQLHDMGFQVMLWLCPFITPDTVEYRETRDKHFLIETPEGKPRILEWWNGYSAALDLTNPEALQWLKAQLMTCRNWALTDLSLTQEIPFTIQKGISCIKRLPQMNYQDCGQLLANSMRLMNCAYALKQADIL